jgi:hypothetical protein
MSLKSMFPAGKLPAKFSRPRPADPTVCPHGHGALLSDEAYVVKQDRDERETSRRLTTVLFCSVCEYAKEMTWYKV